MLARRSCRLLRRQPLTRSGLTAVLRRCPNRTPRALSSQSGSGDDEQSTSKGAAASSDSLHEQSTSEGAAASSDSLQLTPEARAQFGFLFGSSVLLNLGIGAIVPCLPAFAASMGLDSAHIGVIVAVPSFARACLNLPSGHLADVLGRKRPWVVGTLVDGAGCLATAAAGGLASMSTARFFMGGGSAVAGSASNAVCRQRADARSSIAAVPPLRG